MWWLCLRPHHTRIIFEALTQMEPKPEDKEERKKLCELFEAEVNANATTGGG